MKQRTMILAALTIFATPAILFPLSLQRYTPGYSSIIVLSSTALFLLTLARRPLEGASRAVSAITLVATATSALLTVTLVGFLTRSALGDASLCGASLENAACHEFSETAAAVFYYSEWIAALNLLGTAALFLYGRRLVLLNTR